MLDHKDRSLTYDHDFLSPLHHLSIGPADLWKLMLEDRLLRARYLHIAEAFVDGTSYHHFWKIVKQIAPLGLHLHCKLWVNCAELAELRDAAPELRCLTITLGEGVCPFLNGAP